MLPLGLLILMTMAAPAAAAAHPDADPLAYFADWSALTRDQEPLCVNIPANLSLCHNIGYTKMRLPNLLDHDTMHEVSDQARSWVPLVNIRCHADTQLFLCSLFAPVCLERPIYPCRSLCNKVRSGCESTMRSNGYPWPKMLECDKFPVDNDMCITSQSEKKKDTKAAAVATVEKEKDMDDRPLEDGEYRMGRNVFVVQKDSERYGKDYLAETAEVPLAETADVPMVETADVPLVETEVVEDYSEEQNSTQEYDDYDYYYYYEEDGEFVGNGTSKLNGTSQIS